MVVRRAVVAALAVLVGLVAGCGEEEARGPNDPITVWTNEFQPDRLDATEEILADFTEETGIRTRLVPIPEGQLATLIMNAAAAGEMPEVVLANPVAESQGYAAQGIYDAGPRSGSSSASAGTRSRQKRSSREADGIATGVPSDAWGMLLIYRSDVFREAGLDAPSTLEDVRAAAEQLNGRTWPASRSPRARATASPPRPSSTSRSLRVQLVDDDGKKVFDSPQCVEALRRYGELAQPVLPVEGNQDVDFDPRTYFAGPGGDDVLVAVPARRHGRACATTRARRARSARGTGRTSPRTAAWSGHWRGRAPSPQFGSVSTFNIGAMDTTRRAPQGAV